MTGPSARVLRIVGNREAGQVLEALGVAASAAAVLGRSVLHRVVHVGPVASEHARLIRREMERFGGEAVLPEPAWKVNGTMDLLLAGTLSEFDDLTRALAVGEPALRSVGDVVGGALAKDGASAPSITACDRTIPLDRTLIMGIVNVTPDSFSDGGECIDPARAVERAARLAGDGADIVDVGGVSSRYGATAVSEEEERRRVMPVVERVAAAVDVPVSVDTWRATVARAAIGEGAAIVNDISALMADPDMAATVAETGAAAVLMHMRPAGAGGDVWDASGPTSYTDLVSEVWWHLSDRVDHAQASGIGRDRLLVDPGLGFSKTPAQSLTVLKRLGELRSLGLPVLVGPSRKRFIGEIVAKPAGERVYGTAAAVAWAVFQGAKVVRVHDVAAAVDVARVADAVLGANA